MKNWSELYEFEGLDLSESFILAWEQLETDLYFDIEFVVCEDHPLYSKPKPNESACFKKGKLIFRNVQKITGLPPKEKVKAALDANGEKDYGNFDTFVEKRPGEFQMSGDFGKAIVSSQNPIIKLNDNAT